MKIRVELPEGYHANGDVRPSRTAEILQYKDGWMRIRYCDNRQETTVTANAILGIYTK